MLINYQLHWAARPVLASVISGVLLLAGCFSLNEKEHQTADWHTIGYEDAVSGHKVARLEDHRTALTENNITPILNSYLSGYEEGLEEYCHPTTVFQLGRIGDTYPSQCPDELAKQLKLSYKYGRDIYNLNSDIASMHKLLASKKSDLKQTEEALSNNESDTFTENTSTLHRSKKLEEPNDLLKQIDSLKKEIENLNYKLTTRQTQLNRMVSVLQ